MLIAGSLPQRRWSMGHSGLHLLKKGESLLVKGEWEMCLHAHLGKQPVFAEYDFPVHSLDWLSSIIVINSFSALALFLLGWMQWKSECFIFIFFFPVSPCFFNKCLPGRNPKQGLPTSILILTPSAGSPPLPSATLWSFFGLQLCHTSFKVFRASAGPERKGNKKACWKHWKRGLEERNVRRWVGVGKRTSTAKESEQTTYLFSLKR